MSSNNKLQQSKPEPVIEEEITEQEEEMSHFSNSEYSSMPQVKWLLYPNGDDDDIEEIDHKLESLQVKGKLKFKIESFHFYFE